MAGMMSTLPGLPGLPGLPTEGEYDAAVASGDLNRLFAILEKEQGLPAGYLARTAKIESSGNPNAKNPNSSAEGLFQFINSTGRAYGLNSSADKRDPVMASLAAAQLAGENQDYLRDRLGREPTAGELYLAHQQGAGGAASLLANPSAPAASVVGSAAARLNGGAGQTAGQLASRWTSKFGDPAGSTLSGVGMMAGADNSDTLAGGEGGDRVRGVNSEPYKSADGFDAGNVLGAIGMALLSGTRQNPLGTLPQIMQAQQRAAEQREDRRYGMWRDERNFQTSRADQAQQQANIDRSFNQGVTRDERDYDFRKTQAEQAQANTTYQQGITRETLDANKADRAADNARADSQLEFNRKQAELKAQQDKALPAELAGRMALTQVFLEKAPEIRKDLEAGVVTGAWDGAKAEFGIGRPGEIMRQIKSGRDGLQRALTGAGMPASEAGEYADRYLPRYTDTAEKVLSKFDQLTEELNRYRDIATRGRGGVASIASAGAQAGSTAKPSAQDRFSALIKEGKSKDEAYAILRSEQY